MRYTTDHRQETRARVLAEASKEIRANGPHGVAIVGIMKRAGLTHGGFYAHVRSKDARVAAAIGTMFDNARAPRLRGDVARFGVRAAHYAASSTSRPDRLPNVAGRPRDHLAGFGGGSLGAGSATSSAQQ